MHSCSSRKKKTRKRRKKKGRKEKHKKRKRKKRKEAMVGTWSSCAKVMSSKLTRVYRLNLPSLVGWEVHKVRGNLR
jgi:hypothetical protein